MAKCFNCDADSVFIVNNPGAFPQEFCDAHLPKFLRRRDVPEHVVPVNRAVFVETPEEEAPVVKTTKKKAAAAPEKESDSE